MIQQSATVGNNNSLEEAESEIIALSQASVIIFTESFQNDILALEDEATKLGGQEPGLTKAIALYNQQSGKVMSLKALAGLLEALVLYEREMSIWAKMVEQGLNKQVESNEDE